MTVNAFVYYGFDHEACLTADIIRSFNNSSQQHQRIINYPSHHLMILAIAIPLSARRRPSHHTAHEEFSRTTRLVGHKIADGCVPKP